MDVSVGSDAYLCVQVCGAVWMSMYDLMCVQVCGSVWMSVYDVMCVCRFVVQCGCQCMM